MLSIALHLIVIIYYSIIRADYKYHKKHHITDDIIKENENKAKVQQFF